MISLGVAAWPIISTQPKKARAIET